jgi:hypothetical protein
MHKIIMITRLPVLPLLDSTGDQAMQRTPARRRPVARPSKTELKRLTCFSIFLFDSKRIIRYI